MADAYYVFRADNCRFEGMTKEQILAAITQAVETGTIQNVDTGFVTKIKEQNSGSAVTLWVGTQAQYNALGTKEPNCLYIVTDDNNIEAIQNDIAKLNSDVEKLYQKTDTFDISDGITLTIDTPSNATIQALSKKYLFSNTLGIIFYNISAKIQLLAPSKTIVLKHNGGYYSDRGDEPASASVYSFEDNNLHPAAASYGVTDNEKSKLYINLENSVDGIISVHISGWYFAKEEAT